MLTFAPSPCHYPSMRFGPYLTILIFLPACEPIPPPADPGTSGDMSESDTSEPTTGGTATGGTSSTGDTTTEPTGASGSTSETSMDDTSTGEPDPTTSETGNTDDTSGTTDDTTTGPLEHSFCEGIPRVECEFSGDWCADLTDFCVAVAFEDVSPNFCEGIMLVCVDPSTDLTPCDYCVGFAGQCLQEGRPAGECAAMEAECACIARANGVVIPP